MLSILIPTYNSSCLELVRAVHRQVTELDISFEILVGDDKSLEEMKRENILINNISGCRYVEYARNGGPAVTRNRLAAEARHPYLLFLDSDVIPVSPRFIAAYVDAARPNTVVCGGFIYHREEPEPQYALRYHYGITVEEKTVAERSKRPYAQFISMNFLIPKEVMLQHPFDESFHLGYEDTLFGMRLEAAGVPVQHIDNAVYHQYHESTDRYLLKIQRAVKNLVGHEAEMQSYVKLLMYYNKLRMFGLIPLVRILFNNTEKRIVKNLCSSKPSLRRFAFYKLGYLIRFKAEARH